MANTEHVYTDIEASLKCLDENEILYDDSEKYLKRIHSFQVNPPQETYGELLRNVAISQNVFLMYLKQKIILCEPRVRYKPAFDVAGIDEKIHGLSLSSELKSLLRELSGVGYRCLKDENMLDNLVEFDSEQQVGVILFGKMERLVGQFDMVTLINKLKVETKDEQERIPVKGQGKQYTKRKTSLNASDTVQHKLGDTAATQKDTNLTKGVDRCERAVTLVLLAPRNYLYASDIYRLVIYSYLNNITRFFCIVLHIGPLVDRQEIVLYEFQIPDTITKLINSFDKSMITQHQEVQSNQKFDVSLTVQKTKSLSYSDQSEKLIQSNTLNLNQLESMFRKTFGTQLQTVADMKMYFRYYIKDSNGVKNHFDDKKQRYERFIAKKTARKESKLNKILNPDENDKSVGLSVQAIAGSN